MTSAATLAKNKIDLYFTNLKLDHLLNEQYILNDPSLEIKCEIKGQKLFPLKGNSCPDFDSVKNLEQKSLAFYGDKNQFYLMRTEKFVWVFNSENLHKLLSERKGLGNTGEIYIVGSDFRMKSASRFLTGTDDIYVRNDSVGDALTGKAGTQIVKDYRGVEVVSAYSPLNFDQIHLVVLSEIDYAEVLIPTKRLLRQLISICSILILLSTLLAFYLTRTTVKTIEEMQREIDNLNTSSTLQILKAQEEERAKMSYNLHDSVGQYLTALKWEVNHLQHMSSEEPVKERLTRVSELCDSIFQEIRDISQNLMPTLIRDFGCFTAIESFLDQQMDRFPLEIAYINKTEIGQEKLKHDFQLNLFRMTQEFVQNTVKHSKASKVFLSFFETEQDFIMLYEDNGLGMPKEMELPKSLSYRSQLFHGRMERVPVDVGLKFKVTFNKNEIVNGTN